MGKTSICHQFVNSKFGKEYETTIGVSFLSKILNFNNGEDSVKIMIWDTAGQEKYKSLAQMYYKDANAALIVYDITNKDSFNAVEFWVKELDSNIGSIVLKYIIGNKADLMNQQEVTFDSARIYAESIGGIAKEISAKENIGVKEVFEEICKTIYPALDPKKPSSMKVNKNTNNNIEDTKKITLESSSKHSKNRVNGGCCS